MANQDQDVKPFINKMIVYGVKVVNSKKEPESITQEDAEIDFRYTEIIKSFMASLTPAEFVNLFPIRKDYLGHRYELKDYFHTRDYLKSLDPDKPIGEEITMFLWEYTNGEINEFNVNCMGYLNKLRELSGEPSLMEKLGIIMGVKTCTLHTDQKGKQFLVDKETGKTTIVSKGKPKYLRLIR